MLAFGPEQEERTAQLIDDIKGTARDTGVLEAAILAFTPPAKTQ